MLANPLAVFLLLLCVYLIVQNRINKKTGNIAVRFTRVENDRAGLKYIYLIFNVKYFVMHGSEYNKEEASVEIYKLLEKKLNPDNLKLENENDLKRVSGIMNEIGDKVFLKSNFSEMRCKLISIKSRISQKTVSVFPDDIFVKK